MTWFMVGSLHSLRMGPVTRKAKWLEIWNFQSYPLTSEKWWGGVVSWRLKPSKYLEEDLTSFGVDEHHVPGGWYTPVPWRQKFLCLGPSKMYSLCFFAWLIICVPHDKSIINISKCSSEPWTVLINYQTLRWCHGNPDLEPVSQKYMWQPPLAIGVWIGGNLVRLSPSTVGSDAISR